MVHHPLAATAARGALHRVREGHAGDGGRGAPHARGPDHEGHVAVGGAGSVGGGPESGTGPPGGGPSRFTIPPARTPFTLSIPAWSACPGTRLVTPANIAPKRTPETPVPSIPFHPRHASPWPQT